ncbi:hypothetical protein L1987_52687 [Smallanthus sonchifolius]|uniref:Uncharacterized protein n=1 Tax=Smallanthus sonchifolius TaxID=185202 RepID=A0ACB9ETU6_9ASTR|nr:hypothetical protein L1987_52687 [Smallanthus sonchifolius]
MNLWKGLLLFINANRILLQLMLQISPCFKQLCSASSADCQPVQLTSEDSSHPAQHAQRYPINVVGGTKERGTLMDIVGRLATIQQEKRQAENEKLQQEQSLTKAGAAGNKTDRWTIRARREDILYPVSASMKAFTNFTCLHGGLAPGRSESFLLDYSHRGGDEAETLAIRDSATLDRTVPYQWKPSMKKEWVDDATGEA